MYYKPILKLLCSVSFICAIHLSLSMFLTVCAKIPSCHECMNFPLVCILCLSAGGRRGPPGRRRLHAGGHLQGRVPDDLKATAPQLQAPPQWLRLHPPGVVHRQTTAQEPRQGARGIRGHGRQRRTRGDRAAKYHTASTLPERHGHRETPPGV